MKKIVIFSAVILSFLGFTGCNQEEIEVYKDTDNIYFSAAVYPIWESSNWQYLDNSVVSFGLDAVTVKEKFFSLVIRTQGKISNNDRKVKVTVDPASTAIEGTNYTLPQNIVMRAGKVIDTIAIKIKRTPDLKGKELTLILNLEENDFFQTKMNNRITNTLTNKTLSFVRHQISFNDNVKKPLTWLDYYVGVFTSKKFFLMCDVMKLDSAIFLQGADQPGVSSGDYRYYGNFMKRYLVDLKVAGTTIYEDDGTEMVFP